MDALRLRPVLQLCGLFTTLLARVEPPTNVTLQCGNMHNILEWNYGQLTPGLRFRVISSYLAGSNSSPSEQWVDPPPLKADISFLSDPANEYSVQVIAVIGQDESDPAPSDGLSFSYFKDTLENQQCSLELKTVNVTLEDDSVLFSFEHPSQLYHTQSPHRPSHLRLEYSEDAEYGEEELPEFKYNVQLIGQMHLEDFSCFDVVCEGKLPMMQEQEKHCLNITGELEKMAVKSTRLYCSMPFQKTLHDDIFYILISLSVLIVSVLLLFLMYKQTTKPTTPEPNSMSIRKNEPEKESPVQEQFCVARVEPSSPTPLLSYPEDDRFTHTSIPFDEPDVRLPIGTLTQEGGVGEEVEAEQPDDEGQGYMRGGSMGEDEEPDSSWDPSGYEKRTILVNLGRDERAEGYCI